MTPPDDATLRQYLEGELSEDAIAEIELYFDAYPETVARLESLTGDLGSSEFQSRKKEPHSSVQLASLISRLKKRDFSPESVRDTEPDNTP